MAIANDSDNSPDHMVSFMDRLFKRKESHMTSTATGDGRVTLSVDGIASADKGSTKQLVSTTSNSTTHIKTYEDVDEYECLPQDTTLINHLAAGAFAGIMEHTVMYPVDAIKTRMQVAGPTSIYSGIIKTISKVSAAEGSTSLWRGMTSMMIGAGPAHAVYFAVYEGIKNAFGGHEAHANSLVTSIAGAGATTTSDALMNPFDVIKQRMQLFGSKYRSFFHCASDIYRCEGIRAFYVSYPTTLMMNVPFTATNFTVYEKISSYLNPSHRHDPITHCLSGAIAGGTAAAITTPLDVVKTLLQTKAMHCYDYTPFEVSGFASAARYIYNTQGFIGFLRGMRPRVVASMPATAISWTSYEMAKFYISKTTSSVNADARF